MKETGQNINCITLIQSLSSFLLSFDDEIQKYARTIYVEFCLPLQHSRGTTRRILFFLRIVVFHIYVNKFSKFQKL
jgi:hypothetical protein